MKPQRRFSGWIILVLLLILVSLGFTTRPAMPYKRAFAASPPGPDRYTSTVIEYMEYIWWLVEWRQDEIVCELAVAHEGLPTLHDVYNECSENVAQTWENQEPCPLEVLSAQPGKCDGYYIFLADTRLCQKEIPVVLPAPEVNLSLENCVALSVADTTYCEEPPRLVLTGVEPLPDETITLIEGVMEGEPFTCDAICKIDLETTDSDGLALEFWAYSSYGDSSEMFTAQIRVADARFNNPEEPSWYVDVLSTQWHDGPRASCAESWEVFPPVGGPPDWLTTPRTINGLQSNRPYAYLAAQLIRQGFVDTSGCLGNGLLIDGSADSCGLDAARAQVIIWQNRFDRLILETGEKTGIPARLLKNLFARESQFWPSVIMDTDEIGLGQLTDDGAETALLWNPGFYKEFCPQALSQESCDRGYIRLGEAEQKLLRAALLNSADAFCHDCPLGLDVNAAEISVETFAHTLQANCEQTGQVVLNATSRSPAEVVEYVDLWKFTLANYNVGPGCLYRAVEQTYGNQPLTWENVSANLEPACQGAVEYVKEISQEK